MIDNVYTYNKYSYIYNNIVVGKDILIALYTIGELLAQDVPFEDGCLFVLIICCDIGKNNKQK